MQFANSSILGLSLSQISMSPALSVKRCFIQMSHCSIVKSMSPFVFSSFGFIDIISRKTNFAQFLSTPIEVTSMFFKNSNFSSQQIFNNSKSSIRIEACVFKFCQSNSSGSAILAFSDQMNQISLTILSSSFISCYSEHSGTVSFKGSSFLIAYSCAMDLYAVGKYQFFRTECNATGINQMNRTAIDQASKSSLQGSRISFAMGGGMISSSENNLSRCYIRADRVLGSFIGATAIDYTFNTNFNCSGTNYLHFHVLGNGIALISDSTIAGCKSPYNTFFQSAISFCGLVSASRLVFIKTFIGVLAANANLKQKGQLKLVSCVFDVPLLKIRLLNASEVVTEGCEFGKKDIQTGSFDDRFSSWKCKTEETTPATSFVPVAKQAAMNGPNAHNGGMDEKAGNVNKAIFSWSSLTLSDFIHIAILAFILLTAASLFILTLKQKSIREATAEERERLISAIKDRCA